MLTDSSKGFSAEVAQRSNFAWGGLKAGPEKGFWQLPLLGINLAKDSVQFSARQQPVLLWAARGRGGNTQLGQEGCRGMPGCTAESELWGAPFPLSLSPRVTAQLAHMPQGRAGSGASSRGRAGLEVALQGEAAGRAATRQLPGVTNRQRAQHGYPADRDEARGNAQRTSS